MKKFAIIAIFATLLHSGSQAQSQEKAYALMIMNFARNIQWPQQNISNEFTIGVMSYPPLVSEMQVLSQSKRIAGRQIILKEINSPSDVLDREILFIPAFKSKKLPEMAKSVGNSSTLIVTNTFQLTPGSGINFVFKNGKLAYQISSKSIEAKGMKIPLSVKNMGILVN